MVLRTAILVAAFAVTSPALSLEPITSKIVVLTFDDACRSHLTNVCPLLKEHGFGATFFVTEGFDFKENKKDYLTWDEIAQLHHSGFEIGNHTRDHLSVTDESVGQLEAQLTAIDRRCEEHAIPKPTSFAWPGNRFSIDGLPVLQNHGILFARRGGAPEFSYDEGRGVAYEPALDHPLLIPSAGDARPDWTMDDFRRAVEQARYGRIVVLQFHGVPDEAHPWVSTPLSQFKKYMAYLKEHDYQVIAMRDLRRFVDPQVVPKNPLGPIEDRQHQLASGRSLDHFRPPRDDNDLRYWLENMLIHHQYTWTEASAATGMAERDLRQAAKRFRLDVRQPSNRRADRIAVFPYPGGRHPRIGFRDGAIRPQRETKVSVFLPWPESGYVVADVPEAIWVRTGERQRELLYLAHTHVPTMWSQQDVELPPLEWTRHNDGTLTMERTLPNGVTFGTRVIPHVRAVQFDMWLSNGTRQTLQGLAVQNCVMLKEARGFARQNNDGKVFRPPFAATSDSEGRRWIVVAFETCQRGWGNTDVPCLHADPQFPDCEPGQTQRITGWISFYEGDDIEGELDRLAEQWGME